MSNQFVFRGINDQEIETAANRRLARILEGAPFDSTAAALLEKIDDRCFASIDIYSTQGPFVARASGTTPGEALDKVLTKITQLLENWRATRFSHRSSAILFPFADMGRA